jgi:hypothetical protein
MFRLKHDYTLLKKIFDENNSTLLQDYSTTYLTRDTRILGKCILCENSFNKTFDKINKNRNFGCEKCCKILKFNKIKNTMLDKYGVEYASQAEQFRDKMKKTKSWLKVKHKGIFIKNQLRKISKKNNLKIKISGLDSLIRFDFLNIRNKNFFYKEFINQMLKKGFLASNVLYLSISHTSKLIKLYLKSFDQTLKIINVKNLRNN